ncbi:DsbA family protein [Ancylobacter sp. VNQ12]|uniref:DsbA family protein n=1 Tax=Ancylobacter sp. VNQ12 TaxID=3400920 RepID=UPI003BFBC02C
MVIAADRLGLPALELSHALLRALWSEEKDVTQPEVRIEVANALGLDGEKLGEMEEAPEIMQAWLDSHEEARQRGVFGTPTWIYKDVLYWGQDRLSFLDEALSED